MFNIRPDKRWFGFGVEPLEDLPGFRMNSDGTVRDASAGDLSTALPGIDPGSSASLPGGTMFNVQPERHLPGLHNFRPPEERVPGFRLNADGSIRDASALPSQLNPGAVGNPFGSFDQLGTRAFTSVGDGSPPPYLAFARGLYDGGGSMPALDAGARPAGLAPPVLTSSGPPLSSPTSFAGVATGGIPPDQSLLGQTAAGDGPRPPFASFTHAANPLPASWQHSPLSFTASAPDEGLQMAQVRPADALMVGASPPPEGLQAETDGTSDPNVVRVADGEDNQVQVAQGTDQSSGRQKQAPKPGRNYGAVPQIAIERGMTELQKKINRDQAFRELTRQPLTADEARNALPDDWESTKPADLVDEIKRAAERHGLPVQLLARLLYQEGKFNEPDKLKEPLAMDPKGNKNKPIGYAQMTVNTLEELKRQATLRGDTKRRQELETYSLADREQSFDAAAEQLAYLYRHMGGSWPKAVASYNVGQDLKRWFDGANMDPQFFGGRKDRNNKPIPSDKWTKEVPAYLRFILRGAAEDPTTGEMYSYQPSGQYRVRDRINRPPARNP